MATACFKLQQTVDNCVAYLQSSSAEPLSSFSFSCTPPAVPDCTWTVSSCVVSNLTCSVFSITPDGAGFDFVTFNITWDETVQITNTTSTCTVTIPRSLLHTVQLTAPSPSMPSLNYQCDLLSYSCNYYLATSDTTCYLVHETQLCMEFDTTTTVKVQLTYTPCTPTVCDPQPLPCPPTAA